MRWLAIRQEVCSASLSNSCKLRVSQQSLYTPTSTSRTPLTVHSDYVPLVNVIGIIYQIRDDYLNLSSTEYSANKGLCEDLTEGKFSFPIIHSIRSDPTNLQLINILKQKTTDDTVKRYAVKCMEATGTFEYCRKVLATLSERARKMCEIEDTNGKGTGVLKIIEKMAV